MPTNLEFTVGGYSTPEEAKKALNTAAKMGWEIVTTSADGRRLWVIFSRPARPREDGALDPEPVPVRPRVSDKPPEGGGEFA